MTLFSGRAKVPPPVDPDAAQLARLTARHDQAAAYIERTLATNRGNTEVTDVLLDLRNLLRPPERPA